MKNWEMKCLDEVCDLITCGVAARPKYVEEGIPFLSAKNVKDGQIIWSGYNCISEITHKELTKNNKPIKGDVLYTRVGSYGEAAVIEDDYEFSVFVSLTLIKTHLLPFLNHHS
jgi:type I restriction enzyme S subunit